MRRRELIAAAAGAFAATVLAGGVAWAAIPDDAGVVNGCYLKVGGVLRVVDTAKGHKCLTSLEVPISWSQKGPKGDPGPTGPPGTDGADGVSPTVTQLPAGDPNCPAGGAAITDADGSTAYVCSGEDGDDGADGEPFSGTFTSPNGEYSISVTDAGVTLSYAGGSFITLAGPDLTLRAARNVTAQADQALTVASSSATQIQSGGDLTIDSDDLTIGTSGDMSVQSDGSFALQAGTSIALGGTAQVTVQAGSIMTLQSSSPLSLVGSQVRINAGSTCAPGARAGDPVLVNTTSGTGAIVNGSPTVCIG
jgi:hypothetical protein